MSGHQNLLEKLRVVEAFAKLTGYGNAAGVLTRAIRDLTQVPETLFEDAFDGAFNPAMRPNARHIPALAPHAFAEPVRPVEVPGPVPAPIHADLAPLNPDGSVVNTAADLRRPVETPLT